MIVALQTLIFFFPKYKQCILIYLDSKHLKLEYQHSRPVSTSGSCKWEGQRETA